ncbi:MAG: hypothetical protein CMP10_21530 [Zetaproteobacteria bacterium]|nr:hypothetical protein [Pseudobdellovibrionaceae bacterium]|tara:strand:- start:233 stop:943 length:711 start_codon:yes stop_codon:yes gene_type:complete
MKPPTPQKLFSKAHGFIFIVFVLLSTGFRINTNATWDVAKSDPTVWLDVDGEITTETFADISFPDAETSLDNVASNAQILTVIRWIISDYNNIATSYLRLALPSETDPSLDSSIAAYNSGGRSIEVVFGSPSAAAASGYATTTRENSYITGCKIVLSRQLLKYAKSFKRTLTHEIGHCFGLMHTHADQQSIMSYSSESGLHTLGTDDLSGITFLYPKEKEYAAEVATLGMACARNE